MVAIVLFYVAAAIGVGSTVLALTRTNASHGLIYLVVSLLSIAVMFFTLGAPFAAALEIVIYAGAIVVLFLFVVMMLNLGKGSVDQEKEWFQIGMWYGPALLVLVLFVGVVMALLGSDLGYTSGSMVSPKQVGIALFTEYILAVELAGVLLLAALVGAFHLGRRYMADRREEP